jgi:3-isopropylmalate dehydrogenase
MDASYSVALLPGDGIGPEVTEAAARVLDAAASRFGFELTTHRHPVGWEAVRHGAPPLPPDTLRAARSADAVLLGAVGHPDAEGLPPARRPEAGLLALRKGLGCHTNLRPLRIPDSLVHVSPLRPERARGVDFVVVRELGGGLYYGEPRGRAGEPGHRTAVNTLRYTEEEIRRVAEVAFELARSRRGRLTSVDKANVLEVSQLWREVVQEVASGFPEVDWEHMLVDRAAMELVLRPTTFDVILTGNLFGDILTDEAAGVAGSLGLLPSASLGSGPPLFEPVHGSAPELAGQDAANPTGAILSAAMLLELGLGRPDAARAVEAAVEATLSDGVQTGDLAGEADRSVGTRAFTDAVIQRLGTGSDAPDARGDLS